VGHLKRSLGRFDSIAEHLKVLADGFHPIAMEKKGSSLFQVGKAREGPSAKRVPSLLDSVLPRRGFSSPPPPIRLDKPRRGSRLRSDATNGRLWKRGGSLFSRRAIVGVWQPTCDSAEAKKVFAERKKVNRRRFPYASDRFGLRRAGCERHRRRFRRYAESKTMWRGRFRMHRESKNV
jgi:hypothetical protein